MTFWERRPVQFRVIVIILSSFLFGLSLINFYSQMTFTTDENLFADPVSRFYLTTPIPAGSNNFPNAFPDLIIQPGSFLYKINGIAPKGLTHLDKLIKFSDNKLPIKLSCFLLKKEALQGKLYYRWTNEIFYVNKNDISSAYFKYLYSAVFVNSVKEGGVSDRAGMMPGDIILNINGHNFSDMHAASRLVSSGDNDKTYRILRDNRVFDIRIKLVKYGISTKNLSEFIAGLFFIFTGAFLGIRRPRFNAARLLSIALALIGFSWIGISLQINIVHPNFAIVYFITSVFATMYGYSALIQSFMYFPIELAELNRKRVIVVIPYFVNTILCILLIINVFSPFFIYSGIFVKFWPLANIFYFLFIRIIFRKYFIKEYKALFKHIRYSIIIILLFVAVYISILIFNPLLFKYEYANIVMGLSFQLSGMLFPIVILYTIGRYGLLNLNIRIRRNIQYTLLSIFWKILIFALVFYSLWALSGLEIEVPNIQISEKSIEILKTPLSPERQDIYLKLILIIVSIIGAYLFKILFNTGQKILDKKYFRPNFDYKRASSEFSEIIAQNLSISDLSESIAKKLSELVKIKQAGIFLIKEESKVCCHQFTGFRSDNLMEFIQSTIDKFKETAKDFQNELNIDYLPQPLKSVFREQGILYVFPIRYKARLIGSLLVGEKLSESAYIREDFQFLSSIARQSAIAIENSFLYEEVSKQERIKQEMEIARQIQAASLPQKSPDFESLDISGISVPAYEVGGDFYDYIQTEDSLTLIVGDVSGKGTSAALYMSKVQGIMRTLSEYEVQPRNLFLRTNHILYKSMEKRSFITAIAAKFDIESSGLTLSRAGHIPLYHYISKTGEVNKHIPKGLGLGMSRDGLMKEHLEEISFKYNDNDIFLFITDGVMDARNNKNEEFAEEYLIKALKESFKLDAENIRDNILNSVIEFAGTAEQFDDITIVVIKAKSINNPAANERGMNIVTKS